MIDPLILLAFTVNAGAAFLGLFVLGVVLVRIGLLMLDPRRAERRRLRRLSRLGVRQKLRLRRPVPRPARHRLRKAA